MSLLHKPTETSRELVRSLSGFGVPQADIAARLRIDPKTLRAHYRDDLDAGIAMANEAVARTLFQKALAGDNTCMIFWLKTRAGWSEQPKPEAPENDIYNTPFDDLSPADKAKVMETYFPEGIVRVRQPKIEAL